ncbi:MAG: pyridoxal 5'-phosphate synthase glutaminase subunit PdxT [Ruminococcus sp.]|nr:pyridoxal 5'-phosphate synthase glutaminase subunit PdxT [Ruminococcus sp.]
MALNKKIGVLALQGAFIEHINLLNELGADAFEIRQKKDLDKSFHGLILPGGESTVQGKLLRELDLFDDLKSKIENGLPTFGTCAGLLLLAKNIIGDDRRHFAVMDITAARNAYGRQLGSFNAVGEFDGLGDVPMTFIRAPYIESVGDNVSVLSVVDGKIVAAEQGSILVTSYHPELSDTEHKVHKYFLNKI